MLYGNNKICIIARFEDGFEARRWARDEETAVEVLYGKYQPSHGEMVWYAEDLLIEED